MRKCFAHCVLLFVLNFCAVFIFSSATLAEDNRPEIRIGAVLPLTGGAAHLGTAYRDAMLLALEDLGKDAQFQYKILFEDDQGQLKNTASAANKLLSIDKVDAITSMWSNQGQVVAPLAESAQRIHMACAWDKSVTHAKTTFNLSSTPDHFMQQYVKSLEEHKIFKLNVIELNDSGSIAAHDELLKQTEESSVDIVKRQRFNGGDRDFRSLLVSARSVPTDGIYINAGSPELEIIAKQIKELGIKLPVTTIGCFDFTTDLGLFEGSWYMTMTWPSQYFIERYKNRFNRDTVYQLGNFYDMVGVIIESYERGAVDGKPSQTGALNYLSSMKQYRGVLGELVVDKDRAFQSAPTFFKIENGERRRIGG